MLTQAQIAQFHRDGFIRIPQLFQGTELEALCAAAGEVQNEATEERGEHHAYHTHKDGRKVYYWINYNVGTSIFPILSFSECNIYQHHGIRIRT